jgi:hypothetical protein
MHQKFFHLTLNKNLSKIHHIYNKRTRSKLELAGE